VSTAQTKVSVDFMTKADMPMVLGIENQFEFPWSEDEFIKVLRQRNHIGMVAVIDGRVVGFLIYALHTKRIHLVNFAVHRDCFRQGIGKAMLSRLLRKLGTGETDRNRVLLEVRETNIDAQLFFRAFGFRAISILENYYDCSNEDAYLMQYRCPTDTEVQRA